MTSTGPEFHPRLPVEQLALFLLGQAAANPSLIERGNITLSPAERQPADLARIPSLALLSDPTFDIRQYLEDLTSIAITSARQAEESLLHAREIARKTRRGMTAVASFGALSLLVGIAGFMSHGVTNTTLSEVSAQVRSLEAVQRKAADQIEEIQAGTDSLNSEVKQAVATVVPVKPLPPQATGYLPSSMASPPWPDSRQYTRRAVVVQRRPTVTPPPFLVAINRGLRSLFR